MVRMTANDLFWPDQILVRFEYLTARAHDDPERDPTSDEWVEKRITSNEQQDACQHGRKRHPYITQIVNVGEANCGIVLTRLQEQPRHPPIRGGGCKPNENGDDALYWYGVQHAFYDLPQEQSADSDQADRIEDVGASQQFLGRPTGDDKCQVEAHQRQFIGQIVQTVHDQAQTRCLIASNGLDNENACIERYRSGDGFSIVSHWNGFPV